ncbi:MAG: ABC transporter substrate-binding protein [Actinomycetota bacterium]
MIRHRARGAILAAALVAAACGSGDDEPIADAPSAGESAEPATSTAPTTSTVADRDGAASTTTIEDAEPATRIVSTEFGDFEIPSDPERVVVMNSSLDLPTAFDLGADVIGTLSFSGDKPTTALITDEEWASIEVLGSSVETSIETIVAAEPDLVLVTPNSEEEFQLYAQAVTSVPIVVTGRWQLDALQVADALNELERMDALLADYQERADDLGERIRAAYDDPTIAFFRIRPGSLRIHTSLHFAGNILDDVGLQMPEMWRREFSDDPIQNLMSRVEVISEEQVGLLADADHIFVTVQGSAAQTAAEVQAAADEIFGSALWATLPAVQNDQVNFVDGYWIAGTLRAAEAALDDLEAYFFG